MTRPGGPRPGRLIVICGLPGSGKTTLARAMEAEMGAVRMCPDEWMHALGIGIWDEAARVRVEGLQWELSRRLLSLGVVVIIEWGVWSRRERDTLRVEARELGAAVELHFLDADIDVLWERVDRRGAEGLFGARNITRDELVEWSGLIERPTPSELALYDPPQR